MDKNETPKSPLRVTQVTQVTKWRGGRELKGAHFTASGMEGTEEGVVQHTRKGGMGEAPDSVGSHVRADSCYLSAC